MSNPLLEKWHTPFEMPPFEQIKSAHFSEAFELALQRNQAEIDQIANQRLPASFENTLLALESSGELLNQTASVFFNLSSSHTSPEIQ